jgi:hypothetical protein
MKYKQRHVVFAEAKLPTGEIATHPYIILSCNSANSYEDYFTAVMVTTSKYTDRFTFHLADSMFESPLPKENNQARLKLIISFHERDVKRLISRMNLIHFRQLINQIKDDVLAIDERD